MIKGALAETKTELGCLWEEAMNSKPNLGYGFYKVAAVTFPIVLGDVFENARRICDYIKKAEKEHVQLLVFPELSLTGYTCGDMFLRKELSEQTEYALRDIKTATSGNRVLVCVGMPVEDHGKLFNCAVYIQSGEIKGVVPKTYIPNYGEFYEKRWFVSATCRTSNTICLLGDTVPFSEKLLLRGESDVVIATEICEDLWVDSPPSGLLSRAGATIIVNPSASNDLIGKRKYRRDLVKMQSGRCRAGYVYASSGAGESSTDLVFSGHCIIAENGKILAETTDIMQDEAMIVNVIDIEKCVNDRRKYNSDVWVNVPDIVSNRIFVSGFPYDLPDKVEPYPFVPKNKEERKQRCAEILNLQAKGLIQRIKATGLDNAVIGISGGLDSTLALLVTCIAFDALGISREHIYTFTMPGFGTTNKTKGLAEELMEHLGTTYASIDIKAACTQHLKDIGHPLNVYDITYENVQARERTQILFDKANMLNALVIGTGDLSELALGWCTYNGDHMSNYAVNVGVPKTLVKYLVDTYADIYAEDNGTRSTKGVLKDIVDLPISPELLPTDKNGNMVQKTEKSIGKYDLHDFFLYHYLRNGFGKEKILALAKIAFPKVTEEEISKTLDIFYHRFRTQQFKRSCIPDGPKVGSVSLSPRGDLRLPSDLMKMY